MTRGETGRHGRGRASKEIPRVPLSSDVQLFLRTKSFTALVLIWLAVYFMIGAAFAGFYKAGIGGCAVSDVHGCVRRFLDLVYFSFTTQATVGYGDYAPIGVGRAFSIVQAFVGLTFNAVLLGIVVFKALQRRTPIVFPDHLVYELAKHSFWFRFVNFDADTLQNVSVKVYLIKPLNAAEDVLNKSYDTLTGEVLLPFSHFPERATLNLAALRTVSNEGKGAPRRDDVGDLKSVLLSPVHFQSTPIQVTLEVTGYFHTNCEPFFASKTYDLQSICCGRYDDVNNNEIASMARPAKESYLSRRLDATIPSSPDECRRCPYHLNCVFDVAVDTRKTQN
ncbi:MAG: potassium channel family protein [Terriglobia bacterium]